jgi:hypothetical protein
MDRVKSSAVEEARKHVEAARTSLELLRATTAENLWLRDLDGFEKSWSALQATRVASLTEAPTKKEVKRVIGAKPKA